eukprot:m.163672 g.163672  ORF g.163672 m.163672 type:complete len:180 (+) comp15221_c0_seq13:737-1276(+)
MSIDILTASRYPASIIFIGRHYIFDCPQKQSKKKCRCPTCDTPYLTEKEVDVCMQRHEVKRKTLEKRNTTNKGTSNVKRISGSRKIFVTGLPFETSETEISKICNSVFGDCGKIKSIKIMSFKDSKGGKPKCNGKAMITFVAPQAASDAIKLNKTKIDNGRWLGVQLFHKKKKVQKTTE